METYLTTYKTRLPIFKKQIQHLRIYLARQYAKLYPRDLFVGITGSFGNSICVSASLAVLSQKFKTLTTFPNLNPVLNIPETLLKITPQIKKVVLEMGVEYKEEMDFYLSLVQPKIAVLTKITSPHSESLSDLSEILQEFGKLIEQVPPDGVGILNWDDPNSKKIADKCGGNLIYYGTDPKNCAVWAGNIKVEDFKTTFELNLGVERVKVYLQLLGTHQVYPALAAATLGVINNVPLTKIKLALESIQPQEHRLQALQGPNGAIILDDTLNSTPIELEAAIDTVMKIPARRRILVLGEMRELGEYSDALHRHIAQIIYKEKIDQIYLGVGDANIIAEELKSLGFWDEKLQTNLQNSQLVGKLLKTLGRGDICLIKGSQAVRLDEVVKRITKKQ